MACYTGPNNTYLSITGRFGALNDIAIRYPLEQKEQVSLVHRLLSRSSSLYRFCRLAILRIISSGMGLHHQRAARLLLCLGSLETRETKQR